MSIACSCGHIVLSTQPCSIDGNRIRWSEAALYLWSCQQRCAVPSRLHSHLHVPPPSPSPSTLPPPLPPPSSQVAIETGSFSKYAGFTGVRRGWTVVPAALKFSDGSPVRSAFLRVVTTAFNGASNVAQAGGLACLTPEGLEVTRMLAVRPPTRSLLTCIHTFARSLVMLRRLVAFYHAH